MFISATTVALYSMAAALAVLVGRDLVKWLLKEDAELVARRKKAVELANKLHSFGMTVIPNMLTEYGTGDYIGLVEEIDRQVVMFLGPNGDAAVLAELEQTFENVLAAKLADPAALAYIQAKIAALAAPAPAAAPAKS